MNTLSNYAQFQKSPNTTQSTMQTQPMNQQDLMKMLLQQQEEAAKNRAILMQMMQQQSATPATPATPAPVVVAAKATPTVVVNAKPAEENTAKPMSPSTGGKQRWKTNPEKHKALIKDLLALRTACKSEDEFLEKALAWPDFTQTIIANARGAKHSSSRTEGLKLVWKECGAVVAAPVPTKKKKAPVKKNNKRKHREQKWENLGGYYAIDDDMIKDRCVKATTAGIGAAKKSFTIAEQKYVQDLVKMARASTVRADATTKELNKAGDKFSKDPKLAKYQGKYLQLILDFPNLSNRAYGWKMMLRLYAPGCPALEDKGISKKNRKAKKPTSPPNMYDAVKNRKRAAATVARSVGTIGSNVSRIPRDTPMVIIAPDEATQPSAKKQKVDDAVGSDSSKPRLTSREQMVNTLRNKLTAAWRDCQKDDVSYPAAKWKFHYGDFLGCEKAKFLSHIMIRLKAQGLNVNDYGQGKGKWCLDHMIPIRNFNQLGDRERGRCWHYTNITPEPYEYNTWKSDKYLYNGHWSLDQWLWFGRNESFVDEEYEMRAKGMPRGSHCYLTIIADLEARERQPIGVSP